MNPDAALRALPAVDRVLRTKEVAALKQRFLPRLVDDEVRRCLDTFRGRLRAGEGAAPTPEEVARRVGEALASRLRPSVVRCVNATGVVLHTGLGRAPLASAAVEALAREASGYAVVAVDRREGKRIRRESGVARLLCALTGAEAATIVNNNAAATLIALNTLARGREAVLSRGQLVEIGGSFRMPEVFRAAGVVLREVGTTNRTHKRDYEEAIGPDTALLLRVHPSNYRVIGFQSSVPLPDLVAMGKRHAIPVFDDLGAGALVAIPPEPEVAQSLAAGADLVSCSGDKLIGGPQAGILLGKREIVDRIRKNPLFRALRVDKLTLVALEATLSLFLRGAGPGADHPTLRLLRRTPQELEQAARALKDSIRAALPGLEVELQPGTGQVGSGSLPGEELPTTLVALRSPGESAASLSRRLRTGDPPVYARIVEEKVCIDPRTLLEGDAERLLEALRGKTR